MLSGGEVIDLLGRRRGGLDQRRRADLLDRFELDPRKKGRAYSKGNRQIVETGTLSELRLLTWTTVQADLGRPPNGLARLPGMHDLDVKGTRVSCQVDTDQLGPVLRHLTDHGIRTLVSRPATLAELFLRHYQAGPPRAARAGSAR